MVTFRATGGLVVARSRTMPHKVVTIALVVAGCIPFPHAGPPRVSYEAEHAQPDLAAVDVAQIELLTPDKLPDGFTFEDRGGVAIRLAATPNRPSPRDPHRVLGEVRVDLDPRQDRETYLHAMKVEAARHGANALVILDETGAKCYSHTNAQCRLGIAVHVSAAEAVVFPSSKDVLSAWLKRHGEAGTPGAAHTVDLGKSSSFEIMPKRGECLTFVLALDKNARVNRINNLPVLTLTTKSTALRFNRSSMEKDTWDTTDRVLVLDAGCAQGGESVVLAVTNRMVGVHTPPGTGEAIVQIVKRSVDDRTLRTQARQLDDAVKRSDQERGEMAREACQACIGEWRRCTFFNPDIQNGECAGFNLCVERRYRAPRGLPDAMIGRPMWVARR